MYIKFARNKTGKTSYAFYEGRICTILEDLSKPSLSITVKPRG
jgi:hypothetical protein